MQKDNRKFLTPKEVCERYNNTLSVGTLANWRTAGISPPYLKCGGRILYDIGELEKWEENHTCNGTNKYHR